MSKILFFKRLYQLANRDGGMWGRLGQGVKWTLVESVAVASGNFLAAVITARLLGLEDFGAFSIIRSTVYMMASVAGMGLGLTATKHIAELRKSDSERLNNIMGLCSVIAVGTSLCFAGALLLFAHQIAAYSLGVPQIADQLRLAAFYIFFVTINGFQIGILVGFEAFAQLAKINLIQVSASLTVTALFTWAWGLTGASMSLVTTALISCFFHHLAVRAELIRANIKISYAHLWREKDILTGFTFPAALSVVIGAISVWFGNAIIVRQADGLAQMAIFAAAFNVRSLIMFIPSLVNRVASPILCSLLGEGDNSNYSRLFWFNTAASAIAGLAVAGVLAVAAPLFLVMFGKDFVSGGTVVTVVAIMSVVEVIANALYQQLYAYGKLWWQLRTIICWSIVLIGITYPSAKDYGALGLATAYLAAHIVSAAMYAWAIVSIERAADFQKKQ